MLDFERVEKFPQKARKRAVSRPPRAAKVVPVERGEKAEEWGRYASLSRPVEVEAGAEARRPRFRLTPELQLVFVLLALLVSYLAKRLVFG